MTTNGSEIPLWGEINVVELDNGDDYITLWIYF